MFLYHNGQTNILCEGFYDSMGPKERDDKMTAFRKAHLSFGIWGIVFQWLKDGMQESAEEVAEMIKADFVLHGMT